MNKPTPYSSSLTDAEWAVLEPLLPPPALVGRKRTIERRAIVDALLYRLVTGCQWRQLPAGFPGWSHGASDRAALELGRRLGAHPGHAGRPHPAPPSSTASRCA